MTEGNKEANSVWNYFCSNVNFDADEILGYTSVRRVKIRDRRLGFMFLFGVGLIFSYVIGYNVYGQQLYRKSGDILGNTRLQLNRMDSSLQSIVNTSIYCGEPGTAGTVFNGPGAIPFERYPCSYLDPYDSVWPSTEVAAMFISTRITRQNMTLPGNCSNSLYIPSTPSCNYVNDGPNVTYYVADIEMSTLQLEHLFTAPQLGISRASVEMQGKLVDNQNNIIDPCDDYRVLNVPCPSSTVGIGIKGRSDNIPLITLLRAAGIPSLDIQSGSTYPLNNITLRQAGFALLVTIAYSNYRTDTHSMDESTVMYTISVDNVPDLEFSGTEVLPNPGAGTMQRTTLERHGIRIIVRQSGTVGVFDAATLLVTANTIIGLLAVVKAVVDFISTRFMPARHIYSQYLTVRTADFSDLDSLKPEQLARFRNEDLVNVHPSVFGRVDKYGHIHMDVPVIEGALRMEETRSSDEVLPNNLSSLSSTIQSRHNNSSNKIPSSGLDGILIPKNSILMTTTTTVNYPSGNGIINRSVNNNDGDNGNENIALQEPLLSSSHDNSSSAVQSSVVRSRSSFGGFGGGAGNVR